MREAPAEGYNYIFGLRSSNTSTADAADFAIKKKLRKGGCFYGAACVNRTRDNTITNRVLYQLS